MFTSRFTLSLLAVALVGVGLSAQGRDTRGSQASGSQRGGGRASAEGRGGITSQGMGGQIQRAEGSLQFQPSRPSVRHLRRTDGVVAVPHYIPRCTVRPDFRFWKQRDIMAEIQEMARRGSIPVLPVGEEINEVNGVAEFPSGFKGYGFVVPAGGTLNVRLHHGNEGWFRVLMVNKWGDLSAGMLQNLIPTGNPEVRYTNPSKETQAVYVIVDDPGWMSSVAYPYTLSVQRNWEPGKADTSTVRMVEGIWAANPVGGISAEFGRPHSRASFGVGSRW